VAREGNRSIEIQVRTTLQHLWAQLSEKYADSVDPSVKYRGGPKHVREHLGVMSVAIRNEENYERQGYPGRPAMRESLIHHFRAVIDDIDKTSPRKD